MSLRLILIRHAKSAWDDPLQDDHDRPLNGRGRKSATTIGQWLATQGHHPAEVACSTAIRAVQTWEGMAPDLGESTVMRRIPALYHAAPDIMLETLQNCAASPVLMIGHNPGIAEFAARLVTRPPRHDRFDAYPTCATLVAEFAGKDWTTVTFGTGQSLAFITPRELIG
ncbi:phosphohistidine phosphatase [Rhodovulum imhoffii]|uniref:Phosphohistidine phosphatase n=1 Tax=Rhodovulum imhoffii TaxID=365340 RepID=A0A2T5BRW4_9RHOB|nr:histidine phosphatase family protein [Rhodovulum imhoffii]MBK5932533.1 phosphoglycerate mutase [Rhodovulum imhoffii]PTN02055.1 phosphohistidine phosphatase [Rhodovulum imhoffii]